MGSDWTLLHGRMSHEVLAKGLMLSFKEANVKAQCKEGYFHPYTEPL